MVQTLEGNLIGTAHKVAIVVSRFNDHITKSLLESAIDTLVRHGVDEADITVAWVPGAFELPLMAQKLADTTVDAVIALGCVIRGATPHFDYVCSQAANGLNQVGLTSGKPVIFGVLTTETIEQAVERAGTKAGNKGSDAALSAIEMVNLVKTVQTQKSRA